MTRRQTRTRRPNVPPPSIAGMFWFPVFVIAALFTLGGAWTDSTWMLTMGCGMMGLGAGGGLSFIASQNAMNHMHQQMHDMRDFHREAMDFVKEELDIVKRAGTTRKETANARVAEARAILEEARTRQTIEHRPTQPSATVTPPLFDTSNVD